MVVLLLLTVWITGVYSILVSSQRLSDSTAYRIEAIQIARDGLEAMMNIRDTNWIEFWGDVRNCWNTFNYNPACVWSTSAWNKIRYNWNRALIVYRDELTWKFFLNVQVHNNLPFSNNTYRNRFRVRYDDRWFYTQTWSINLPREYTREIRINYLDGAGVSQWSNAPNNPIMELTTIVQWQDPAASTPRRLEMSTRLTNWKDRN